MQIFFPSLKWLVFLCIVLWFIFHLLAVWISHQVPDRLLSSDHFLFRQRNWEKGGRFYAHLFQIKKWKKYLPDGAALSKKDFRKKHLTDFTEDNLNRFLIESRRAELNHFLAITPFWIFGLFGPFRIIGYMLIYALLVNIPCIIAQRYNRPRIEKLLARKKR